MSEKKTPENEPAEIEVSESRIPEDEQPEKEKNPLRRFNFAGVVHTNILQALVINVVCPYMAYQILTQRASTPLALLIAALFPLASILYGIRQHRLLDPLGTAALYIIVAIFLSATLLSPLAPAFHGALFVALAGIGTLATQLLHRPLAAYIERYARSLTSEEEEGTPVQDQSSYRHSMSRLNVVWGYGQIAIALLLAASVLSAALQSLSWLVIPVVIVVGYLLLGIWTVQYWDRTKQSIDPQRYSR